MAYGGRSRLHLKPFPTKSCSLFCLLSGSNRATLRSGSPCSSLNNGTRFLYPKGQRPSASSAINHSGNAQVSYSVNASLWIWEMPFGTRSFVDPLWFFALFPGGRFNVNFKRTIKPFIAKLYEVDRSSAAAQANSQPQALPRRVKDRTVPSVTSNVVSQRRSITCGGKPPPYQPLKNGP